MERRTNQAERSNRGSTVNRFSTALHSLKNDHFDSNYQIMLIIIHKASFDTVKAKIGGILTPQSAFCDFMTLVNFQAKRKMAQKWIFEGFIKTNIG